MPPFFILKTMKENAFNRNQQTENNRLKIIVAIERLSTAFRFALSKESKTQNLSPLQAQILLFIATHAEKNCTVSCLAKEFAVTKPTISDAVAIMELKKFVQRKQCSRDARTFFLELTSRGKSVTGNLTGITDYFTNTLKAANDKEISAMWGGMVSLIEKMQSNTDIPIRMCFSCRYFSKDNKKGAPHYCSLMQKPLKTDLIRIDCPEHELHT